MASSSLLPLSPPPIQLLPLNQLNVSTVFYRIMHPRKQIRGNKYRIAEVANIVKGYLTAIYRGDEREAIKGQGANM